MGNALYPTLAGLTWNNKKVPEFNTIIQRSVDLSELRGSFTSTPVYNCTLTYDLLRDDSTWNELDSLMGFFLARQGKFDSWLFLDDSDSVALLEDFGTGDNVTTGFQLTRSLGAFTEDVKNIGLSPSIYKAGVLQSGGNYSINSTGLVTFVSAPAANAALTWSGTYYMRCRFKEDTSEFNQFMYRLWEAKQVEFIGSFGTKI